MAHPETSASGSAGLLGSAVLEAVNLTRRFGERIAVDDVSFRVAPGETYGLLGPNGAGKTATIRLVCGLLQADIGNVQVAGMPVSMSATRAKSQVIGPPPKFHGARDILRESTNEGA